MEKGKYGQIKRYIKRATSIKRNVSFHCVLGKRHYKARFVMPRDKKLIQSKQVHSSVSYVYNSSKKSARDKNESGQNIPSYVRDKTSDLHPPVTLKRTNVHQQRIHNIRYVYEKRKKTLKLRNVQALSQYPYKCRIWYENKELSRRKVPPRQPYKGSQFAKDFLAYVRNIKEDVTDYGYVNNSTPESIRKLSFSRSQSSQVGGSGEILHRDHKYGSTEDEDNYSNLKKQEEVQRGMSERWGTRTGLNKNWPSIRSVHDESVFIIEEVNKNKSNSEGGTGKDKCTSRKVKRSASER